MCVCMCKCVCVVVLGCVLHGFGNNAESMFKYIILVCYVFGCVCGCSTI